MLLGITGYASSGKDSVGQILVQDFGFQRVAFADKVREFARAIDPYIAIAGEPDDSRTELAGDVYCLRLSEVLQSSGVKPSDNSSAGWTKAKTIPDVRRLLQRVGTEGGRDTLFDDVWVEAVLRQVGDNNVVVTDARFINEFRSVQDYGGYMIRVNRPGTGPLNNHPSETEVDSLSGFHFVINNDGTLEDLRVKVHDLMTRHPELQDD